MKTIQIKDLKFEPHSIGMGATHATVQFKNGYGASVITGSMFYTSLDHPYEVAVLDSRGKLTYKTPITNDVIGHLNESKANEILKQIQELPKSS
jgi:hypothetical protein